MPKHEKCESPVQAETLQLDAHDRRPSFVLLHVRKAERADARQRGPELASPLWSAYPDNDNEL